MSARWQLTRSQTTTARALIDAHLDGELSPAETAQLEVWLAQSDEHRRLFAARALDHLLQFPRRSTALGWAV